MLSVVAYFGELPPARLREIAQAARRHTFDKGETVFLEGDPSPGLCIVESGWLKSVKLSPSGREQVLRVVGPGEVFNEVGVFVGPANPVTVMALEPAVLWMIERRVLLRLVDKHNDLARVIIENLAGRALHLLSLVEDLSLRTVEGRLARLLLVTAKGDVVLRKRWATQAEMAARLGTVPDVMQRALRVLTDDGLIEVVRQEIRILDRKELERRAFEGG